MARRKHRLRQRRRTPRRRRRAPGPPLHHRSPERRPAARGDPEMTTRRRTSDCTNRGAMSATNAPRAFTLIEVLIAVLVLALGLLGLGAVFPVAVRAQRISSDDVLGTAAVNSARAYLNSYNFHSAMIPWNNTVDPDNRNFWRDWRDARPTPDGGLNSVNPAGGPPSAYDQGYWLVPEVDDNNNRLIMGVPANP